MAFPLRETITTNDPDEMGKGNGAQVLRLHGVLLISFVLQHSAATERRESENYSYQLSLRALRKFLVVVVASVKRFKRVLYRLCQTIIIVHVFIFDIPSSLCTPQAFIVRRPISLYCDADIPNIALRARRHFRRDYARLDCVLCAVLQKLTYLSSLTGGHSAGCITLSVRNVFRTGRETPRVDSALRRGREQLPERLLLLWRRAHYFAATIALLRKVIQITWPSAFAWRNSSDAPGTPCKIVLRLFAASSEYPAITRISQNPSVRTVYV